MARARSSRDYMWSIFDPRPRAKYKVEGPGAAKSIDQRLKSFRKYFQEALGETTRRLATAGANAARKRVREAETPWGQARIRGEYFGVNFRPYGRSAGREDTGFMLESLSTWMDESPMALGVSRNRFQGYFGWPEEVISKAGYIAFQEIGFYSTGSFDPVATAASGIAKFKPGMQKYIHGVNAIPAGRRVVEKIARSFYAGAWNEAVRKWKDDGFTTDPGRFTDEYPKFFRGSPVKFTNPVGDEF